MSNKIIGIEVGEFENLLGNNIIGKNENGTEYIRKDISFETDENKHLIIKSELLTPEEFSRYEDCNDTQAVKKFLLSLRGLEGKEEHENGPSVTCIEAFKDERGGITAYVKTHSPYGGSDIILDPKDLNNFRVKNPEKYQHLKELRDNVMNYDYPYKHFSLGFDRITGAKRLSEIQPKELSLVSKPGIPVKSFQRVYFSG
jgi:hypothetical protein